MAETNHDAREFVEATLRDSHRPNLWVARTPSAARLLASWRPSQNEATGSTVIVRGLFGRTGRSTRATYDGAGRQ